MFSWLKTDSTSGRSAIHRRLLPTWQTAAASLLVAAAGTLAMGQEFSPPPGGEIEGIETLTQGPIHEAFAHPTDLDPTPGPVVTRQPPEPIAEEPPDFMPEGSTWISGYWIWDDERSDFIWVTGAARVPPPGMQYVPGYWTEVDGGFQRVAGFWMNEQVEEIQYNPPPPESLEAGPSSPAPADNYFWVPGSWSYYDTGFRWRAGYWSPYQPDWVWVPARWAWTPGGYCYLPGFWDFRLSLRGHIFAPIYFQRPIYQQANWAYRPWCVIPADNLFIHLWVRPTYSHYYFGNYYGPQYVNFGLRPWWELAAQRRYYDPFAAYCHVHYRRQGIDFVGRVRGWHDYYVRHEDLRPARTWREQQVVFSREGPRVRSETQLFASNLVDVARRSDSPVRLTRIDQETRRALVQRTEQVREMHVTRKQVERDAAQVVARLPRDVVDRDAGERDRADKGGKGSKGRPDVAQLPRSTQAPKFKLPKRATTDVVVGEARPEPGARGRPGELDRPGERGRPGETNRPAEPGRSKIGRRDTIPPPMPSATEPPSIGGTEVNRGKGKAADRTDRTGRIDGGEKGRPTLPRIDVPGKTSPDTPQGDRVPKGRPPEVDVPTDRGPKGKGKGRPDAGKSAERVLPGEREIPQPVLPRPEPRRPDVVTPRPDISPAPEATPRPMPRPEPTEPRGKGKGKGADPNPRRPADLEQFPRIIPDGPEPAPRPETGRAPRIEPRLDPRTERNVEPRVEPRVDPRPNVRPEPRSEARPQSRPEVRPQPRPEPRGKIETPRPSPRGKVETPRPEPRAKQSNEDRADGKGKGKGKERDDD